MDENRVPPAAEAAPAKSKVEMAAAEPAEVAQMAAYQAGSVVSRVLLRRNTGSLTLFAFDQGQELSEHTAPFDALAHALEGEAEILIEGRPFRLSAGQAILMPANRPHAVRAVSRFKMLLSMLRS